MRVCLVAVSCLGNNEGPALTINATYKIDAQPARPVPPGGCRGAREIPAVVAPGVEAVGCLGFLIPRESGRLILSGNSNFDFYLPVARRQLTHGESRPALRLRHLRAADLPKLPVERCADRYPHLVTHALLVGLGPQEIVVILVVASLSLAFWAVMLWGLVQLFSPLFRRRRPHNGEASPPQQGH